MVHNFPVHIPHPLTEVPFWSPLFFLLFFFDSVNLGPKNARGFLTLWSPRIVPLHHVHHVAHYMKYLLNETGSIMNWTANFHDRWWELTKYYHHSSWTFTKNRDINSDRFSCFFHGNYPPKTVRIRVEFKGIPGMSR